MPRKRKAQDGRSQAQNRDDANWAQISWTTDMKDEFAAWIEQANPDYVSSLTRLCDDSYRVSVKRDYNQNCHRCTCSQQNTGKHKNAGILLSELASTPEKAIMLCDWLIFEYYRSEPLPTEDEVDAVWW